MTDDLLPGLGWVESPPDDRDWGVDALYAATGTDAPASLPPACGGPMRPAGGEAGRVQRPGDTTRCQFDHYPATVHPGDTISILTEGATAERLASAVLLRGCSLLGG